MKTKEKFISNLNSLLIMNAEVEKIYTELVDKVSDEDLKTFFSQQGMQRGEFSKDLKAKIVSLGGSYENKGRVQSELYKFWMNIRNFVMFNKSEESLMNEVRDMQGLTINKYNDLLRMLGLPLSICKLLIKQRDRIQDAKDSIERHSLIAYA
ncbi:PA2169 family four-helix-bundle protein [Tamlana sp. s12]|uniref:PA2169 family four-helix-bundle protein n=1 Tax=Tamlana sp. s12 TaxID=1630406 RepID=UPI00192AA08F|nr:PA2169 family four-helix-bundle protein [Tamlana sp. s12]QQY83239.1 PA2169 family four-helix-bundle protein [Tamlana sp. s12]